MLGRRFSAIAWVVALFTSSARADVASEARFFDGLARRAYEAGQYERALDSFQLVHDIAPSYRTLYNIALCADLAGRAEMAFSLYQEYLKGDDADGARRTEATARIERVKSRLALVAVETDPPQAAIYVDRKELGQFGSTPMTIPVSAGERVLIVERAGFATEKINLSAKLGSVVPLRVALKPLYGVAEVSVVPSTAKLAFSRDGAKVPAIREQGGYRLPVGSYRVSARAPGFVPAEAALVVRETESVTLELMLLPAPRPTGRLLVSTGKVTAEVFVDGKRVAVTPAALPVAVGPHLLEVRAGKRALRRRVTIAKERATFVALELGSPSP